MHMEKVKKDQFKFLPYIFTHFNNDKEKPNHAQSCHSRPQCGSLWSGESQWTLVWVRCVVSEQKPKSVCRQFDLFHRHHFNNSTTWDWQMRSIADKSTAFYAWVDYVPLAQLSCGSCEWFLNLMVMAAFLEKSPEFTEPLQEILKA